MSAYILVKDYMNRNVITVNIELTVEEVERQMLKYDKDSFPVVNDKNQVVGMIGISDLLFRHPNMKIGKIMSKSVIGVPPDMKIDIAARIMFRNGISRLPVVDPEKDNEIVGIFTHTDIIRAHIERVTPSKVTKLIKTFEDLYTIKINLETKKIRLSDLIPSQKTTDIDELKSRMYELKKGLAEPIVVIKSRGGYIIVDGHHRALAAHRIGFEELDTYLLVPEREIEFGLEREARKLGLKSVEDIIIDEEGYSSLIKGVIIKR